MTTDILLLRKEPDQKHLQVIEMANIKEKAVKTSRLLLKYLILKKKCLKIT